MARDKTRVLYVARERERLAEKGSALQRLAQRVTKGPLMLLRRCFEEKMAVRVVTRHAHGVRGTATGTMFHLLPTSGIPDVPCLFFHIRLSEIIL